MSAELYWDDLEDTMMVRDNGIDMTLREYVRDRRIEQGFGVTKVSELIDVTHPGYMNWEHGLYKNSLNGIKALLMLGVKVSLEKQ